MHKQNTRKAARPCISPAAQTIKIKLPAAVTPVLATCAAHVGQTPEAYLLDALLCNLRCDVEIFGREAKQAIAAMTGGAR